MKHALLFGIGIAGLVASVFALRGGAAPGERRVEYYPSGQVQLECELQEGVREGECRRFWPDGKPMAEGQYENGLMNGRWEFWNEDGTPDPARSGEYVAGRLRGG
jgi:MORN repeat variant